MTTGDDTPARLAALDQRLADLNTRMDRHARAITRADIAMLTFALALIVIYLAGNLRIYRWEFIAAWAVVAMLAAGSLIQGRMLRGYRAENRELRARVHDR
jgi:hypothetical protein